MVFLNLGLLVITAMDWKEAQSGYQAATGFSQPQLEQVLREALYDSGCPIIRSKGKSSPQR